MTTTAAGYQFLDTVAESETRLLVRALDPTGAPVVVKLLKREHPAPEDAARLRHELEIASDLDAEHVVRPLRIEQFGTRLGLVLPDIGGVALDGLIPEQGFVAPTLLSLAHALSTAVASVHAAGLIHRDLKPANLLVNPELSWVRVTDFGLATRLARMEAAGPADAPVGTLAYLAPEQTGRMNRSIDQRSDLYSVGVTLYQLATGRVPFGGESALELIHAHLAALPLDPRELNPLIPDSMAEIILRLLAKQPEDRYQSAVGLCVDLTQAQQQLTDPAAVFSLGTADRPDRLMIPERLFGREAEIEDLTAAIRAAGAGRGGLLLLSGSAGVGKTALVGEIGPVIAACHGIFLSRKFDQFAPIAAPIQVLDGLVRHALREPPERLAAIRGQLQATVGANLAVLIEIAPELELIVGPQPPAAPLGAAESEVRFGRAFCAFQSVFARPGAPEVVFLDDLQWAPLFTLKLMAAIVVDPALSHLLVIGAYRSEEVPPSHPLNSVLTGVSADRIHRIDLQPLTTGATADLVAATLGAPQADLTAWLHELTEGNPLYLRQALESLIADGVLRRVPDGWKADLTAVRAAGLHGDVVEFLTRRLTALPSASREVLQVAATVGNTFELDLVAAGCDLPTAAVAAALDAPIAAGLVVPLGDRHELIGHGARSADGQAVEYRFRHDRVQQAAHAEADTHLTSATRLRLGEFLRARLGRPGASLFGAVDHLNAAEALILDDKARLDLAELNLRAAREAVSAAAYDTVERLTAVAERLLPADATQRVPDLVFDLGLLRGSALAVLGRMDEAEAVLNALEPVAASPQAYARLCETRCDGLENAGRLVELYTWARAGLARLGRPLPTTAEAWATAETDLLARLLDPAALQEFADLPRADEAAEFRARLLRRAVMGAYATAPSDLALINAIAVDEIAKHGRTSLSPLSLGMFAMIPMLGGHHELAVEYGQLARRLGAEERTPHYTGDSAAWMFALSWAEPFPAYAESMRRSFATCHAAGEAVHAMYSVWSEYVAHLLRARDCRETLDAADRALDYHRRYCMFFGTQTRIRAVALRRLMGLPAEDDLDIEATLQSLLDEHNLTEYAEAQIELLRVAVLLGEDAAALAYCDRAEGYVRAGAAGSGIWNAPLYVFGSIACARLARSNDGPERERLISRAQDLGSFIDPFADLWPNNWAAYRALVHAELALSTGDAPAAERGFLAAIDHADEHGYVVLAAWSHESLGRLHLARGRRLGRAHLVEARRLYEQCAAGGKVAQLDAEFGGLAPADASSRAAPALPAVLAGSQAIAAEIAPDRVIEALLGAAQSTTGATNAAFVSAGAPLPPPVGQPGRLEFPLRHKGNLLGTLVLDGPRPFGPEAIAALELLAPQAGISRENAALYADLEAKVAERSSELSEAMTQLRAMQDQIVQSEKLAALGGLVAGVAHEIHNPIGVAVSAASHLVGRTDAFRVTYGDGGLRRRELDGFVSAAADAAELILTNCSRAAELVASFKQVAIDQSGQAWREFALGAYLRDVVASLAPRLRGSGHRVEVVVEPELIIAGHPGALAQVATNLVLNSLLHGYPNGGAGRLSFAATASTGGTVRLVYRDDGVGIPHDALERVFEAFFTTKRDTGGSGLGLHIVHTLVTQRLAGSICVVSEAGHGTQFVIELPQHPEDDDV